MRSNTFLDILLVLGTDKRKLSSEEVLRLRKSLLNNTAKVLYHNDAPIGYILYAKVDAFTARSSLNWFFPRYDYEWSDGRLTFITDVVFVGNGMGLGFKDFYNFIKSCKSLIFLRNNAVHIYLRSNSIFKRVGHSCID